jgi:hypothetical protein
MMMRDEMVGGRQCRAIHCGDMSAATVMGNTSTV